MKRFLWWNHNYWNPRVFSKGKNNTATLCHPRRELWSLPLFLSTLIFCSVFCSIPNFLKCHHGCYIDRTTTRFFFYIQFKIKQPWQTFIQAVLIMPIFEQKLNLFCLLTNDYKVIVKCRWGFGGVALRSRLMVELWR